MVVVVPRGGVVSECNLIVGALVGSACLTAVRKTNKGGGCAMGKTLPGQAAGTSLMLVFGPTCLRTLE